MPGQKDDERYSDAAMGIDPLGDDDEVLARTLYSSGNKPLATQASDARSQQRTQTTSPAAKTSTAPKSASVAEQSTENKAPPAAAPPRAQAQVRRSRRRTPEPQHYKVLSISLYNDDIERLDELVKDLKKQGFTRMNRSALIRFALDQVDVSKMPKGY